MLQKKKLNNSSHLPLRRWFVPDSELPRQALTAIQTEEQAIQQLHQKYAEKYGKGITVRVVPPKIPPAADSHE